MNRLRPLDLLVPDFVCIGSMRSGTSWLYRQLSQHPDIALARRKEVHYFDRFLDSGAKMARLEMTRRWWYAKFFLSGNLAGRVTGELTPAYVALAPDRLERFHRMMPRTKLVFAMRDPVDRAWSQLRKDFETAGVDPESCDAEQLLDGLVGPERLSRYGPLIRPWLEFFPRDQLYAYYFEDMTADPQGGLERLARFLEVDEAPISTFEGLGQAVNSREQKRMPPPVAERLQPLRVLDVDLLCQIAGHPPPWIDAKSRER